MLRDGPTACRVGSDLTGAGRTYCGVFPFAHVHILQAFRAHKRTFLLLF